jgi:hypothetical protein
MFLKYIDFIFQPFRAINNKILGVKNIKGNIQVDINRTKNLMGRGQQFQQDVNQKLGHAPPNGQPGAQGMQPGMPQGQGQAGGAPGQQGPNANPPIRTEGVWIFKKKFCTQCSQQLDKSWDACPFCAQISVQVQQAPAKLQALKTQAFVLDQSGNPGQVQLLGWIVPLQDKFMSSKHAEIKAENGMWVLKDSGSTNGTYVNNKRVERHELVDNDFIKFGSAMCKFKSL